MEEHGATLFRLQQLLNDPQQRPQALEQLRQLTETLQRQIAESQNSQQQNTSEIFKMSQFGPMSPGAHPSVHSSQSTLQNSGDQIMSDASNPPTPTSTNGTLSAKTKAGAMWKNFLSKASLPNLTNILKPEKSDERNREVQDLLQQLAATRAEMDRIRGEINTVVGATTPPTPSTVEAAELERQRCMEFISKSPDLRIIQSYAAKLASTPVPQVQQLCLQTMSEFLQIAQEVIQGHTQGQLIKVANSFNVLSAFLICNQLPMDWQYKTANLIQYAYQIHVYLLQVQNPPPLSPPLRLDFAQMGVNNPVAPNVLTAPIHQAASQPNVDSYFNLPPEYTTTGRQAAGTLTPPLAGSSFPTPVPLTPGGLALTPTQDNLGPGMTLYHQFYYPQGGLPSFKLQAPPQRTSSRILGPSNLYTSTGQLATQVQHTGMAPSGLRMEEKPQYPTLPMGLQALPSPSIMGPSPPQFHKPRPVGQPPQTSSKQLTTAERYFAKYPLHPAFLHRYIVGEELGMGGFGFVTTAEKKADGSKVAVKFIFKKKIPQGGWARDPDLGVVPMEIYILKNVRHVNVVQFMDYFEDERFCYLVEELHGAQWSASNSNRAKKQVATPSSQPSSPAAKYATLPRTNNIQHPAVARVLNDTMEGLQTPPPQPVRPEEPPNRAASSPLLDVPAHHLTNSNTSVASAPAAPQAKLSRRTSMDLFECIEQHQALPEPRARMIFRQVADAICYLHSKGVVHRDIKDENIVIDEKYHVKLIDFGSAAVEPRSNPNHLWDRFQGTVQYAAPEILRGEKYRGKPNDIWALGILLYTMLYGESPFSSSDQAINGTYRPPNRQSSPECMALLNWMLKKSWRERPTADQVMQSDWLKVKDEL